MKKLIFSVALISGVIFFGNAEAAEVDAKILIVPGHDNESWGTDYRGVKEADMTLALGVKLFELFSADNRFKTYITRNQNGYAGEFSDYFVRELESIRDFILEKKNKMIQDVSSGKIVEVSGVPHNTPAQSIINRLYGINKWANDNAIDITIHIHFNDVPRKNRNLPGDYSGIAVYIPERQFYNYKKSKDVADSIFNRLYDLYPLSNLPKENLGVVEDQDLIATGSYNSVNNAAMLIEYGYIYEPVFQNIKIREKAISDLALQTYLGVKDYFGGDRKFKSSYLPYSWKNNLKRGINNNLDVLSLQAALMREGIYPPAGFSKNDCPLSGNFGPCTERAVKEFQRKYKLKPVGEVGPKTRAQLNKIF